MSERERDLAALSQVLADAVRAGGALALASFRSPYKRWMKDNASPVSEVDIAVDEMLRERLMRAAPDYGWLSEESADDPIRLQAERLWIVDPIDGTRAFLELHSDWAVSAALIEGSRPIAAALFAPVTDTLYLATAGGGATRNGAPLQVADNADLDGARIAGPKRRVETLARLFPSIDVVENVRSLALRIARVGDGGLDAAFAGPDSHDWDLAAADLIVHEAGGLLTALDGEPITYNRERPTHPALFAAAPARSAALRKMLRDHRAEFA